MDHAYTFTLEARLADQLADQLVDQLVDKQCGARDCA